MGAMPMCSLASLASNEGMAGVRPAVLLFIAIGCYFRPTR
ncbi:MAG: hypothetical protein QOJ04_1328 [Caballeronia sp.]|jgi:hypothetical protein|nr:hypothetical protein [Caballeronia sp.]